LIFSWQSLCDKQGIYSIMEEPIGISNDIVQLARLAMVGRPQDIQMFIRRLTRRYNKAMPEIGSQLLKLLQESPSTASPIRNADVASIPVDQDSRLQLVRFECPIKMEVQPIWSESIGKFLHQFCSERQRESELIASGISPSRSILFHGLPGVGKTLAAKWIATELDRPLLTLDLSAVMSSYLGRTGINIRHVLEYAKGIECVLLLDELDAIAKRRDDLGEVGELKRLVTVLIQEIDDWPESGILIAATNHANLLDPAIWRRFDLVIEFPMPTKEQIHQAVIEFLGPDSQLATKEIAILASLLDGASFSEAQREIMRLRREALVFNKTVGEVLQIFVQDRTRMMPLKKRKEIAINLVSSGYSQRQANNLTGVSRDTIRNATRNEKIKHKGK